MSTFIVNTSNNTQAEALKAFMLALKIEFKEKPYDPEFVAKVKKAQKQVENGQTVKIDNIDEFLGL